jgi:hypothetical protein
MTTTNFAALSSMPEAERILALYRLSQHRELSPAEESLIPPGPMPEHYRRMAAQARQKGDREQAEGLERDWSLGYLCRTPAELWGPHAELIAKAKVTTPALIAEPVTTPAVTTPKVPTIRLRVRIKALGSSAFQADGKLLPVRTLGAMLGVTHVAIIKAIAALDREEGGWRKAAKAQAPAVEA